MKYFKMPAAILLKLLSLAICFFSIWFCIIGIGFVGISIAQAISRYADDLAQVDSSNTAFA